MRRPWFSRTFAATAVPQYRYFWFATFITMIGLQMSSTARSVVAFDIAETNSAVGVVALGSGLAFLFITPFGGVVADRVARLKILMAGHSVVAAATLVLAVLILTDQISILWLAVGSFVTGAAGAFFAPARQAFAAELVPRRLVANAIALTQLVSTVGRVGGPFLAGLLLSIGAIGGGGTYLIMTGMFILVLLSLFGLPARPPASDRARGSVTGAMLAGMRHVRDRPRLRLLTLSFIALVVLAYPFEFVLPGLLENELGRAAEDTGLLLGFAAIGGLVLSLVLIGMAGGPRAWSIMLFAGAALGLGLIALAAAPSFLLGLAAMVLVGGGQAGFRLLNNAQLMIEADPAFYGRVYAITILGFGLESLAAAPIGVLADAIGERAMLGIMGSATLVVIALTGISVVAIKREGPGPIPPRLER